MNELSIALVMARYQIKNFPSDLLWFRMSRDLIYILEDEGQASMRGVDEGGPYKYHVLFQCICALLTAGILDWKLTIRR